MKKQIKFTGFMASFRIKLKTMTTFTDAEYRIWDLLIHIADWDKDHKETFGTTGESLRDIQKHYLPWSIGKLSKTVVNLTKRGLIGRRSDGKIEVKNFQYLVSRNVHDIEQFYGTNNQSTVHSNEQGVRPPKQEIHPTEQGVRPPEQQERNQIDDKEITKPINTNEYDSPVHPSEQSISSKQTLEKPIQQQMENDEMLLIEKLKNQYGNDIEIPLRKYGLALTKDSTRRMESRMRGGERVGNSIGYITNLCKEGVPWAESKEKMTEDKVDAREAKKQRRFAEVGRPLTPEELERKKAALEKFRKNISEKFGWKIPNHDEAPQSTSESPPAKTQ